MAEDTASKWEWCDTCLSVHQGCEKPRCPHCTMFTLALSEDKKRVECRNPQCAYQRIAPGKAREFGRRTGGSQP